ncbi:MAG: RagB/SusD family nutrient uptake outer membrane protein [Candidatus Pedobacter colombiensis]|uniref:RagB/SusD family nutrient uptake outer membrane protein n=1 Tax=Candidatus Pedobacter colombiensis TaxID=3121371 RepID=A0AAJ5W4C5_9SPHI|nr:RagB/SusD family nutrient uptake outer membrane protein [Pedobacter sp.]WEK18293.1 MAG: RagB/SusD family nutrient uptake outer membrane protein [Pedobacter sp.]
MKKILFYIFNALMLMGIASCKDFLEVKPKGVILPEKLSDYENMLNSPTMTQTFPSALMYCTDDYYGEYSPVAPSIDANMFLWRREIDLNDQVSPAIWGLLYRVIYDANVIVKNAMQTKDAPEQRKKEVLGEALLVRSDAYFTLLTVFAKAYDPATAGADPGLPLVTSSDVTGSTPPRSGLRATLDTIVNNTMMASEYLPLSNLNRYRGTKAAAYGLLSRIYLYMADYPNAAKYAELGLKANHQLLDYNTYTNKNGMPVTDLNPEILWQRASEYYGVPAFLLYSDDLKTYFNATDLRYSLLTSTNAKGLNRAVPPGRANFGITFQELYLNVAEAAARGNDVPKAMETVNKIRKKRIKTVNYQDLTAGNSEAALAIVLAERRRELAYSGQRWMDMKRLDREGRMSEVIRVNKKSGVILTTLKPHSKEYTFQIPTRVRRFNPQMEIN